MIIKKLLLCMAIGYSSTLGAMDAKHLADLLLVAIQQGGNIDEIGNLLKNGANPFVTGHAGQNPFFAVMFFNANSNEDTVNFPKQQIMELFQLKFPKEYNDFNIEVDEDLEFD